MSAILKEPTVFDSDRMSFLDGHRVYMEFEKPDGYITFDGEAWICRVKSRGGVLLPLHDSPYESLRDALDALTLEARDGRWK